MDVLGHGLLLDDGDLVLEDGDLAPVSGLANLAQALTLRLLTPYGSDRFHHLYGLSVEEAFTRPGVVGEVRDLLRLEIVRTLAADPRVHEVTGVEFAEDPTRRVWSVSVLVEAVDGRTAAVSAELEV
ncbi:MULTISPECIES: hypothetical protein [unclassified Streptomyces]|uniref:hypothetical protein n=1 Tax=unclassified Streptomyces TaxID=2593676 RepID=UPI0016607081|nr:MULTISPECIES: hypothetical protein [unclassified Streptomyces]MBD0708187.1 hypothetical protein [Streptomyces sp. CBMA291]MBD0714503.1 hypothetical protein [Streptomyces sp. CBMA370]